MIAEAFFMGKRFEERKVYASFAFGDMILQYLQGEKTGMMGLRLLPRGMEAMIRDKDCRVAPLIQVKLLGDAYSGGFVHGRTMQDSFSTHQLRLDHQDVLKNGQETAIETWLKDERGYRYLHRAAYLEGEEYFTVQTAFYNDSGEQATLEMLSSFTLGEISPFTVDHSPERLFIYRIRSNWSAEGRLIRESVEQLHLEPSWGYGNPVISRWGQVGSVPVRDYVPFVGAEDAVSGVIWAAQLCVDHSWQMEMGRIDNGFTLAGGQADREMGHWMKHIAPGESFRTPPAILTVSANGIDDACERLIQYTENHLQVPKEEEDLPPLFNEYCATWGTPSDENIRVLAERIKDLGLAYFMIDAGWYAQEPGKWDAHAGSWDISPFLFPQGLDATLDYIRACGMQPGIWFEMESVGCANPQFHHTDWLLKRDGIPLTVAKRRFWDFRKPEVRAYLQEKVADFLKNHGLKYVKFDYNESLGIGVDGAESPAEGMRQHLQAVREFLQKLRRDMPELVIEICSSGGHRLNPSFLLGASMASASDTHECEEIPIVAANMHRIIPVRQSQIWAVLRPEYDEAQLYYKMTGGMLGRLCLSGPMEKLSAEQWAILKDGLSFYRQAAPILKKGKSRRYGEEPRSWRDPSGWQAVVRENGEKALVVAHAFHRAPETIRIPVPAGYEAERIYARNGIKCICIKEALILDHVKDMDGIAVLLKRIK